MIANYIFAYPKINLCLSCLCLSRCHHHLLTMQPRFEICSNFPTSKKWQSRIRSHNGRQLSTSKPPKGWTNVCSWRMRHSDKITRQTAKYVELEGMRCELNTQICVHVGMPTVCDDIGHMYIVTRKPISTSKYSFLSKESARIATWSLGKSKKRSAH